MTSNPHGWTPARASYPLHWDAFIAHATEDEDIATRLHAALSAASLRVYLAKNDLKPGEAFTLEIPRAQNESRSTILLISEEIEQSPYVQAEITRAISLKRRGGHQVIPVVLTSQASLQELPYGLETVQAIVFRKGTSLLRVAHQIESSIVAASRNYPVQFHIDDRTVIIVTGCHHWVEIFDRPRAVRLMEEITRLGASRKALFLRSVILVDIWFLERSGLHEHPNVISVGGSSINEVTKSMDSDAVDVCRSPEAGRWAIRRRGLKWALYGEEADDTRDAMDKFIASFLEGYLDQVWGSE